MDTQIYVAQHLVKNEELNHHGTLYAGRTAEWFVESGFIAAASMTKPQNIVCLQIHGMKFSRPVHRGDLVKFESKIVDAGRTRLVAYIAMYVRDEVVVEGFITFIHVDLNGLPQPHGIELTLNSSADIELQKRFREMTKK